jgi:hypothetical protein
VAASTITGQDGRVPVSEALLRLTENTAFWTGEHATAADPDARELRVSFPVTGGYALVLDLDPATGERTLGLREPAWSEPVQLGSALPAGPATAALRWWELDVCARVIALEDPTLPHPGLVVALLSPFAPPTADDDERVVATMRAAAYRSLRREVRPIEPAGPEQQPLPIFASDDWWPAPRGASPRVLDDAAIAVLTREAGPHLEVRSGSRFPRDGLADLVRLAAAHLDRLPHGSWYAETRPLARHILDTGDLAPVPALLGALTEAGCDHPTVLDALSEPLVPVEAYWMVETLAGAGLGTLLRRVL